MCSRVWCFESADLVSLFPLQTMVEFGRMEKQP